MSYDNHTIPDALVETKTYEQWINRPVYVTHCKTQKLSNELGIPVHLVRVVAAYRGNDVKAARDRLAKAVRRSRIKPGFKH